MVGLMCSVSRVEVKSLGRGGSLRPVALGVPKIIHLLKASRQRWVWELHSDGIKKGKSWIRREKSDTVRNEVGGEVL